MQTLRRAVGNSTVLMASQAVTWIASFGLSLALGRYLDVADFGRLYLAMSFAAIFGVLAGFGLDRQFVRAVAREPHLAGAYLVNSLAIKVVVGAATYLLILALTCLLGYTPEVALTIALFNVVLLLSGPAALLGAVYQAAERLFYVSVGDVLNKIIVSAGAILLLVRGYGPTPVAAVFVAGGAVSLAWNLLFLHKVLPADWRSAATPAAVLRMLDLRTMRMLAAGGVPFLLYAALGSVYFRVDVVLLSKLTDTAVVGWYGAAYRLFETLVFLPNIVAATIMLPILARLSTQSRDDLRLALGKGLDVMTMLGLPICTGLFVLAEPIIRLIFPDPEFSNAVPALQWLAVALFLLYVNTVLGTLLISLDLEKKIVVVSGLALVFNLAANWLLIPHFRHVAAAATTTATEVLLLVYFLAAVPRDLLSRGSLAVLLKAGGAAGAMVVALWGLRGQSVLLLVPVGGLVYCLSALPLRLVPAKDLRLFKEAIATRRAHREAAPAGD
ncbi:MAG: oligosaccharide flippase family protein [Chloroflexota bacterium]|nr:oligosaccharide flippase family protein [Chloroflexota bacterium]